MNVYLIHGWGGKPEGSIRPWLKKELELRGFNVLVPEMPNTDYPQINERVGELQKIITEPEESIIVGHSLGGLAILFYLEQLEQGKKLAKAICMAGVFDKITNLTPEDEQFIKPWLAAKINRDKVKASVGEIVAFFSDNDKYIPIESEKIAREYYGARTIIEHEMGHYNEDDEILQSQSILEEICG